MKLDLTILDYAFAFQPLLIGFFTVLLAGFVQGLTSFGFALIAVPILAMLWPMKEVVPLVVALSLLTNIVVLFGCFRSINFKKTWILLLSSFVAVPLGTRSLMFLDPRLLKAFVGLFLIVVSLTMLAGKTFRVKNETLAYIPVGLASGFLNGSISMSGPPIALFLSNQNVDKNYFRANISIFALVLNVATVVSFFFSGLVTTSLLTDLFWFVPGMIFGVVLGNLGTRRLDKDLFRKLALGLIFGTGIWTVVSLIAKTP